MVLSSTFEDTIAAEDADYAKKLKIYSYKIRKEWHSEQVSADADVFNIYVSGIDTLTSNLGFSIRCQYHHDRQSEDQASPVDNDTHGMPIANADGETTKW